MSAAFVFTARPCSLSQAVELGAPFLAGGRIFWKLATHANHVVFHRLADSDLRLILALSRYRGNQPQNHGNRMWGCLVRSLSIDFPQPRGASPSTSK